MLLTTVNVKPSQINTSHGLPSARLTADQIATVLVIIDMCVKNNEWRQIKLSDCCEYADRTRGCSDAIQRGFISLAKDGLLANKKNLYYSVTDNLIERLQPHIPA